MVGRRLASGIAVAIAVTVGCGIEEDGAGVFATGGAGGSTGGTPGGGAGGAVGGSGAASGAGGAAGAGGGGAGGAAGSGGGSGGSAGSGGAGGTTGGSGGSGGALNCSTKFSGATGVNNVCSSSVTNECKLNFDPGDASCQSICQTAGGTCKSVHDNTGTCGTQTSTTSCTNTSWNSAICFCTM